MKDLIRIVLVDPNEQSRNALQRLLGGIAGIWLSEVFNSYNEAADRAGEIAVHLTIVSLDQDANQALDLIQRLTQANPNAIVLPASRGAESGLILKAMRAGAREFLPLPAEPAEVLDAITRLLRGRNESQTGKTQGPKIISVTSAAGGVGCTTLAVNLATTLAASTDQETLLLDLDLMFGAVDAWLDIPPDNSVSDLVQNFERLDLTLLKRSITRHSCGLYVVPHPATMQESAAVDPERLRRLFGLLRAAFGTMVIDTSKGLQSSDFMAFEISDVILLVVQLDLVCLRNTSRLLTLFREFEGLFERVQLVANRVGSVDWEISQQKAEDTLKMPISWQIPNAAKLFQEVRIKGAPLAEVAKGSRVHQRFLELARSLRPASAAESSKPRKGLFAAFF
ncbi:MAG: CpaE family protein [Isosphaerales bacterium]